MTSEYIVDLCFIRQQTASPAPFPEIEDQLSLLFSSQSSVYIDRKRQEGLDIAVAQVSGLSSWLSEQEVISHMEERMQPDSLEWLSGYRVQVIPKEDAGTCCLKR